MPAYKTIETTNLESIETIRRPADSHTQLDMYSPAMKIFTDFELQQPLMLESTVSIAYAEELMKKAHVHLKLIIDQDENFRGIVSSRDIARRLHVSLYITERANSFSDIYEAVHP